MGQGTSAVQGSPIQSVAFSPDGMLIASGCRDGQVRIRRVQDGTPVQVVQAHWDTISSVQFSPNGKILASAGYDVASGSTDRTVKLWDAQDTMLVRSFGENRCVPEVRIAQQLNRLKVR